MIVVEGLDNTGKTTLATYLVDLYPMLHFTPSIGNKHVVVDIYKQAWKEAHFPEPLAITDRARLISEYVYNPLLKARPIAYEVGEWLMLLGKFVQNGPHLIIYCNRRLENVRKNWQGDQLEGVYMNLPGLDYRYRTMMGFLEIAFHADGDRSKIMRYDFEQDKIELYTHAVAEYIKEVS